MTKTFLSALLLSFLFSASLFGQDLNPKHKLDLISASTNISDLSSDLKLQKNYSYSLKNGFYIKPVVDDTTQVSNGKNRVQKISIGGLFLAPHLGLAYPLGTFASNSGIGFSWGAKLEFAFSKLYPFVPGLVFESQAYKGDAGFLSNNLLQSLHTEVIYFGGSFDIILNKFIRSDFTTPVFSGEIKYATITRTVTPDKPLEGIQDNESLITFSTGIAFTLYVFDIGVKYTYADVYSNLDLLLKIHFPIIKF